METTKTRQGLALSALVAAGVLAVIAALALSMSLGAGKAYAGGGEVSVAKFKGTTHYEVGSYESVWYKGAKGKVKNVKSSNKKVATAKVQGDYLVVKLKKAGKATISFKYKGKTRKAKIVMHKRENPVASFMVGSQECASWFDDDRMMNAEATGKVKIVPAKGWKITSMETYNGNTGKAKKVKNGKFSMKQNMSLYVTYYNKSKKLYTSTNLYSY